MKRMRGKCRPAGFSLVEMVVVLVIIGLMLGAMLGPLSAQLEARRLNESKTAIEQAREALLGYLLINNRLPCPASATLAEGSAGAGEESAARDASGQCTLLQGVIPWVTLGVPQTDSWGRRLTYRVSPAFTKLDAATPCGAGGSSKPCFTLSTPGVLTVRAAAGSNLATTLPAVVVSHGANGRGGYQPDGAQVAGAVGDELENSDSNVTFVSRPADDSYDDLTTWLATPALMARLVSAGKLP